MSSPTMYNRLQVAGVVAFYMSAALVMVFVNKAVLNYTPELPLVFLLNQLLIAVVLLHGAALFTKRVEIPVMDWAVARKLVPVVTVNIVGLVFNTLCLRDVDASFFQIARGLQLPLTILVSSLVTRAFPGGRTLFAAGMVTIGFFVGVAPASLTGAAGKGATPSLLSLAYGVLSSLMIALHAVLIKSSLPHVGGSTIQLAYWTNAGSAILIMPFVLLRGELAGVGALWAAGGEQARVFWWGSAVTGVFGFLLCVAGLLSIKVTSPVTHMFSSAARTVLQTLLGVSVFGDLMTTNRALSICVILAGTLYYTWLRSAPPPPPTSTVRREETMSMLERGEHSPTSPSSTVFDADEKDEDKARA